MRPCQRLGVCHLGREQRAIFKTFSHSFAGKVLLVANPSFAPYPFFANQAFQVFQIVFSAGWLDITACLVRTKAY